MSNLHKQYVLMLNGGHLTRVLSEELDIVQLWKKIEETNGPIFFHRLDGSGINLIGFVTDSNNILGIDDPYVNEGYIDLNDLKEKQRVFKENQEKKKKR